MAESGNSVASLAVGGLSGRQCTLVQSSYADQLVLGFGEPYTANWPLRNVEHAPWMIYVRYGQWVLKDGDEVVVSDNDESDVDELLQNIRKLLLGQTVTATSIEADCVLSLSFRNGLEFRVESLPGLAPDEPLWDLREPRNMVVHVTSAGAVVEEPLSLPYRDDVPAQRPLSIAIRKLLRDSLRSLHWQLFEPTRSSTYDVDAVVVSPDGIAIAFQVKTSPQGQAVVALYSMTAVRREAQIPLPDATAEELVNAFKAVAAA